MEMIFADAFYFIALYSDTDVYHERAVELSRANFGKVVTTEYVLIEYADAMAGTQHRMHVDSFVTFLRSDRTFEVVDGSRKLLDLGMALYADRPDKNWSLTDCTSFVVMKQRGITEALTHDHHFKQAD
jgi:predicted nucleic acid-binding protein